MIQHCLSCDRPYYYPRTGCPNCGETDLEWRAAVGAGQVYSFTHVHMALGADLTLAAELPYTVVQVNLDEGVRMLSRLVGPGRESVRIGDRVNVAFTDKDGGKLPYFALAPASS